MNNNVKGDTVDISPNETGTYPLYFDENLGVYTFTATIVELNLTKTFTISFPEEYSVVTLKSEANSQIHILL